MACRQAFCLSIQSARKFRMMMPIVFLINCHRAPDMLFSLMPSVGFTKQEGQTDEQRCDTRVFLTECLLFDCQRTQKERFSFIETF